MMSHLPEDNKSKMADRKRAWHDDMIENDSSQHSNKRIDLGDDSSEETWDENLHRKFVGAIFDVGLRNSSPAIILENMTYKSKAITSERVKSKLQKYRNQKGKSEKEYMEEYDAFLARLKALGRAGAGTQAGDSPYGLLEMMGCKKMLGGDAAAFLSYAVLNENGGNAKGIGATGTVGANAPASQLVGNVNEYVDQFAGMGIPFPELTEAEKKTSLGLSMTLVMGLFMSMTQHLTKERAEAQIPPTRAEINGEAKKPPAEK